VPSQLQIYLRQHEAAGRSGYDLARRAATGQRRRPWAAELRQLADEDREDLDTLQALMRRLEVPPDPLLGTALRVGERLGRLKPNGHLLTRAPLSDVVELEGLLGAVTLKAAGWRALDAAEVVAPGTGPDLPALAARADDQLARLRAIHRTATADALRSF